MQARQRTKPSCYQGTHAANAMSVRLKIAKKRKIQAPPAAFAEPEDEAVPELTDAERNEQIQKLKVQLHLAQRDSSMPSLYFC